METDAERMMQLAAQPAMEMQRDLTDEQAALMKVAAGDLTQFALIYERYFDRIFAYCLRRVASAAEARAEAEDLASLVFARAMAGAAEYRGGSVTAWLFRIAHNTVMNHYRKRRTQIPLDDEFPLTSDDDPLDTLVDQEEAAAVLKLIRKLPDHQQDMLWLRVIGGLNAAEIAAVIGKNHGAVRTELHRILTKLRARYAQEFEG